MERKHIPVLLKEVIDYLRPKANQAFLDATIGLGGHAREILKKTKPSGRLLGIDWDEKNLDQARKNLGRYLDRCRLIWDNFTYLRKIAQENGFSEVSGILFDLGFSSAQLQDPSYGLSFLVDQPLDMRLGRNSPSSIPNHRLTAAQIINQYPEYKVANILYQYGDVRNSRRIARAIVRAREKKSIETTGQLVKIIGRKNPRVLAPIFQALRIEVNQELENLRQALKQSLPILKKGGRLVVISYHSGEDRIVKDFFREHKDQLKILTKKPITPLREEREHNPRSRSAKLRAAEKI